MLVHPPLQASSSSVPDFSLEQLDGSVYKLRDHIGKKIIIIDFWATWCKPCKKLLKKLNQVYLDYKQHVEVLAISIDGTSAVAKAEAYIKGKGFSFTVDFLYQYNKLSETENQFYESLSLFANYSQWSLGITLRGNNFFKQTPNDTLADPQFDIYRCCIRLNNKFARWEGKM